MSQTTKLWLENDYKLKGAGTVPAPDVRPDMFEEPSQTFEPYGDNILVVITSDKELKIKPVIETFDKDWGADKSKQALKTGRRFWCPIKKKYVKLYALPIKVETTEGIEQPCDEEVLKCASGRIAQALVRLSNPENQKDMKDWEIGTTFIVSIENYISTVGVDPADHAVVLIYNAMTREFATTATKGVAISEEFVKLAQGRDSGGDIKDRGKKTVGEVLSEKFGLDSKDWHEAFVGKSRGEIIKEAMDGLTIQWTKEKQSNDE